MSIITINQYLGDAPCGSDAISDKMQRPFDPHTI